MPHNENSRVKIPALVHFTRLGYKYISLRKYEGVIDDDTNILVDVLCDARKSLRLTNFLRKTKSSKLGKTVLSKFSKNLKPITFPTHRMMLRV